MAATSQWGRCAHTTRQASPAPTNRPSVHPHPCVISAAASQWGPSVQPHPRVASAATSQWGLCTHAAHQDSLTAPGEVNRCVSCSGRPFCPVYYSENLAARTSMYRGSRVASAATSQWGLCSHAALQDSFTAPGEVNRCVSCSGRALLSCLLPRKLGCAHEYVPWIFPLALAILSLFNGQGPFISACFCPS